MATPRGIRNNNPLNIRKGNTWRGERSVQMDAQFEEFESMSYGLRAGMKLIRNYITGFDGHRAPADTIRKIITRWAPANENNTENYIAYVASKTGLYPDEQIFFQQRQRIVAIVHAMCFMETGTDIDVQLIQSAYDLVL